MNLTKISNKIWEIVGLALGILFLLGIAGILFGGIYGFFQYRAHRIQGLMLDPEQEKGNLKTTVEYGLPLAVEGSDFFMIPVTLEKKKQGEERGMLRREMSLKTSSYDSDYSSYSPYGGPYYNLIMMNKKTGESRPLLSDKGFISGIYFPEKSYSKKEVEPKLTFMLLRISKTDTNADGMINERDASSGFLASIDGAHLTQVTPDHTQMRSWNFDSETQRLFIEVVQDANRDQKYNWDDPQIVLSVNVATPQMGQEFIPAEIKSKIQSVLLSK